MCVVCFVFFFFFFFQAEDGIRDKLVTGVQTCALPICSILAGRGFAGTVVPERRRRHAPNPTTTTKAMPAPQAIEGWDFIEGGSFPNNRWKRSTTLARALLKAEARPAG